MLTPAPISKEFVPYNRRVLTRDNSGLFVESGGRGRGVSRVAPQDLDQCTGKPNCTPCGFGGKCYNGYCVYDARGCP